MLHKFLIVLVLFFNLPGLFGQKEGYNWYFGDKAGVTFNTNPPSALLNSQMSAGEGCASISTPDGRLLFYTDGINIWDSTQALMMNGTGLKGSTSSTQSAVIVPWPDSMHLFFVFTIDDFGGNDGLQYSIVDMKLNGGKGAVRSNEKNIFLKGQLCEKLVAVQNANDHDYWLLATKFLSDSIFAYRITSTGLIKTPVGSKTGFNIWGAPAVSVGHLKISPDRKKIAYTNNTLDSAAIGDFDAATGKVSNVWVIYAPFGYGLEFSPKTRFLYIGEIGRSMLVQYDLSAGSRTDFIATRKVIDSTSNGISSIQIAPDGKIYIAFHSSSYLAAIHAPDSAGYDCRLQKNTLYLGTARCFFGLPNYTPPYTQNLIVNGTTCTGDSMFFRTFKTLTADSVFWEFGDSASGILNTSFKINGDYHIYKKPGTYQARLLWYYEGEKDSLKTSFRIVQNVIPDLGKDTTICQAYKMTLKPKNSYRFTRYLWQDSSSADTYTVSQKGTYILTVIDSVGCRNHDTIVIKNPLISPLFIMSDSVICQANEKLTLTDTSIYINDRKMKSTWNFGDGTSTIDSAIILKRYTTSGTYKVKLVLQSLENCRDSITKTINVLPWASASMMVDKDTQCFEKHSFQFLSTGSAKNYLWDFGDGLQDTFRNISHRYTKPGRYRVFLSTYDTSACISNDSHIVVLWDPELNMRVNKDTQCFQGHGFSFETSVKAKTYLWDFGDGIGDNIEAPKHLYTEPGRYLVLLQATDIHACKLRDSLFVTLIQPLARWSINQDTQCLNNNVFRFTSSGKISYSWNFGTGNPDTGAAVQHRYTSPGKQAVVLTTVDSFSCTTKDSVKVMVLKNPKADFTYLQNPCFGDVKFTNTSTNSAQSLWTIDSTTLNVQAPVYRFSKAGQYTVTLITQDSTGICADTFEKTIDITASKKLEPLRIPNVFTPGTDQFNDCYQLGGLDASCGDAGEMHIYDRWGNLVFKGTLPQTCWNGKLNNTGTEMPSGVYYYVLRLTYYNQEGIPEDRNSSGVVHVIR